MQYNNTYENDCITAINTKYVITVLTAQTYKRATHMFLAFIW